MKTVTVTFNGPSMSGKKAMAELLSGLLTAAKFDVEMDDSSYGKKSASDLAETLGRLNRANTKVLIKFSSSNSANAESAESPESDNDAW